MQLSKLSKICRNYSLLELKNSTDSIPIKFTIVSRSRPSIDDIESTIFKLFEKYYNVKLQNVLYYDEEVSNSRTYFCNNDYYVASLTTGIKDIILVGGIFDKS